MSARSRLKVLLIGVAGYVVAVERIVESMAFPNKLDIEGMFETVPEFGGSYDFQKPI